MSDESQAADITQLVGEHLPAVYRYAYRLTGSAADAEDLTQEVFILAQRKLAQLRSTDCGSGWLFSILRTLFLASGRKNRPIPAGSLQLNVDSIPVEPPEPEAIDREALQQALDELPDRYRVVVVMYYFEDCSYREISQKLDLPMGTVMSRLARAKGLLRTLLFDKEAEMFPGPRTRTEGEGD
jgi:RNA polymerase sigma-70 factor (ECF subfamily)